MFKAGLIYDDSRHYIDHLGPLCAILDWPLIVCEAAVAELATLYYPDLKVTHIPLKELSLPPTVVTCEPAPFLEAVFPGQSAKFLWLPHGHSDKGWNSPLFQSLKRQSAAFVYGQKMADLMPTVPLIRIGNFRRAYFLKHHLFYQQTWNLPKGKNFLYAPTWDDAEGSNSFWNAFPLLANRLPADCNLLIKLHPNTLTKYMVEIEILKGRYENKENISFLPDQPPIYPLLSQCDAYIGDMSSIGYDFLAFNKPLYFLNANPNLPLHRCGASIQAETFDFSLTDSLETLRQQLYEQTFDSSGEALCSFKHRA